MKLTSYANCPVPVMHHLTNGSVKELKLNPFGQVRIEDVADDVELACELLDCAPSEVRYGYVHPGPKVERTIDDDYWT